MQKPQRAADLQSAREELMPSIRRQWLKRCQALPGTQMVCQERKLGESMSRQLDNSLKAM